MHLIAMIGNVIEPFARSFLVTAARLGEAVVLAIAVLTFAVVASKRSENMVNPWQKARDS